MKVGNLEQMNKNENGIRWFETEYSTNCRYANSVEQLSGWREAFKPNGKY